MMTSPRLLGRASRALAPAVVLLALSACVVGPDYKRPELTLPADFRQAPAALARPAPQASLDHWWQGFGDPVLERIEAQVASENLDLAQASARIQQAGAAQRRAAAASLPVVEGSASQTHAKASLLDPATLPARDAPGFERDFNWRRADVKAWWELDLFGGARRQREAADAALEAAVAGGDALRVSLTAEAADAYLLLREAQQRRAVAERQVAVASQELDLVDRRAREGIAAPRELHASRARLEEVRAAIPQLVVDEQAQRARLQVLTGDFADAWRAELATTAPLPLVPGVPADITPAQLLRRRPDVQAAERLLASANADVGAAISQYYPSVSLSGLVGVSSIVGARWLSGDAMEQQLGFGLRWRLFDFGRIDAQVAQARGRAAERLAAYRETALRASAEVELALTNLVQQEARAAALDREIVELQQARDQSAAAYGGGAVSLMDVLTNDRQLLAASEEQVHARAAAARAAVACFRAFGGGWQAAGDLH